MRVYIGPYEDMGEEQKTEIEIHDYDTWSMDHTLAPIILPMLKQLRETKHGAPNVDSSDVPPELRCNDISSKAYWTNGETDEKFHDRWDYVIGEMIFAFEQKVKGDFIAADPEIQKRVTNGFTLFGKYYECLWD